MFYFSLFALAGKICPAFLVFIAKKRKPNFPELIFHKIPKDPILRSQWLLKWNLIPLDHFFVLGAKKRAHSYVTNPKKTECLRKHPKWVWTILVVKSLGLTHVGTELHAQQNSDFEPLVCTFWTHITFHVRIVFGTDWYSGSGQRAHNAVW